MTCMAGGGCGSEAAADYYARAVSNPTVLGIAGTHYCGSTIVGLCLGSHPDVFASGELTYIVEAGVNASCRVHGVECAFWTRDFVRECAADRSSMHAAVAARAGGLGATVVVYGDKLPACYDRVDLGGCLILYKRPEAYAYSALTHDRVPLTAALDHYADVYSRLLDRADIAAIIGYEHFAAQPEEALRSLSKELEISFDPAMLAPWEYRDRLHLLGGNSGAFAQLLPLALFEEDSRSEYWRTAYSPEHVEWIRRHHRSIALDEKWREHLSAKQLRGIKRHRDAQEVFERMAAAG